MSDQPPAGWHPDPDDPSQYRYWNGHAWTADRAPRSEAQPQSGPPPTSPKSSGCGPAILILLGVIVVGTMLGSLGGDDSTPATTAPAERQVQEAKKGDASARLACQHFRNVAGDVGRGLLTEQELRAKLREVYDDAKLSEDRRFGRFAEDMLAGHTARDEDQFDRGLEGFDSACDSIDQ